MEKMFAIIRRFGRAMASIVRAIAAPIVKVVRKTMNGEVVTLGELGFAVWRLLIWTSFLLCMTGAVGVPSMIAMLFLLDMLILAIQLVFAESSAEVQP